MNKKGFTLIELLAVIVILAIIALIAAPIVLNIIKDSRESAGLRSAEMYLKGVETSVATSTINNKKVTDGTYQITKDGDICLVELTNDNTCNEDDTLEVEMNGDKPESGSITIASGKITDIELTYLNGKTIVKNDGKLVYGDSESGSGEQKITITPKKETYTVGDEVTIGEESFYVIADDTEKVTLLTKDNIDTTNLVQSASANTIAFSETNYWADDFTSDPYDLIETGEPDLSHKAARAAYDYGAKVGGTGRLMTYNEATALQGANSDILYGISGKSSGEALNYWLMTACETLGVWTVFGNIDEWNPSSLYYWSYNSAGECGVRPVVEISKDKIS